MTNTDSLPSPWELEDENLHADCRIFEVYKRRFRRKSDGIKGDFFVLDTNDWVNVLAITPNRELVLVRQFRYGSQEYSLEPPGGVIEKGEDPVLAGMRELSEETAMLGLILNSLVTLALTLRSFPINVILFYSKT